VTAVLVLAEAEQRDGVDAGKIEAAYKNGVLT
jgi:HSP20 family molecular chaperone IbpA